ncbi:hypothetical protein TMatcc_005917 [Talaromyces marneffei ATCC 18224]|uniref:uncharacterized protein n=1 Tax=Talaromyces marneffei TaxID=37727 RepID=UPI0012A99FC0|nr:uncharacterized protein EYB26_005587 [Talaromyces marneffei]KAE8554541.1 hypothetical protein EYB25_003080 [Talaromyces marneffei]QGA17911.1 hypothetical protein EYB26_005587 [Talaromyces marneffei]
MLFRYTSPVSRLTRTASSAKNCSTLPHHLFTTSNNTRHISSSRPKTTTTATTTDSSKSQLPILPFVAIFVIGTGSYVFLVKSRASTPRK